MAGVDDQQLLPGRSEQRTHHLQHHLLDTFVRRKVRIHPAGADVPSAGQRGELRITSYNVCYTKLLRLIDGGILSLVPVRFARAMGADVVVAVDIYCGGSQGALKGTAVDTVMKTFRLQGCLFVITSYSIHYTKLYELL